MLNFIVCGSTPTTIVMAAMLGASVANAEPDTVNLEIING